VWIKELNASEPLMRCQEGATFCQKLESKLYSDKHSGHLFTGCAAGVIQAA